MNIQQSYDSRLMNYLKVIFFILWILGIFVGGKFMNILVIIFGLYSAVYFKQVGIETKKFQERIGFKYSDLNLRFAQMGFLIGGMLVSIIGLTLLFSHN